jgi:hypothetical protein
MERRGFAAFLSQVIPIQPRSRPLRLELSKEIPFAAAGEKVLASGGSSTGSKRKLKLIDISVSYRHPRASTGLSGENVLATIGTKSPLQFSSWPGLSRPPTPLGGGDKGVDTRIKSAQDDCKLFLVRENDKKCPIITIPG